MRTQPLAAPPGGPPWQVLIVVPDLQTHEVLAQLLPECEVEHAEHAEAAWQRLTQKRFDLVIILRDLSVVSGLQLCDALRKTAVGQETAILLLSAHYHGHAELGAEEAQLCGADNWAPLPVNPQLLVKKVGHALVSRLPLARFNIFPDAVAQKLARLFKEYESLNYYEVLGVDPSADRALIQRAFHQWSLQIHPDRHGSLAERMPALYERICQLYRRFTEAYRALSDERRRRQYGFDLLKGHVRIQRRELKDYPELATCQSQECRALISEAFELRAHGELAAALQRVREALTLEPENAQLMQMAGALVKLLELIQRAV